MAERILSEVLLKDGRLLERRFMEIDKAELRILETNDKKIKEIEELKEYIKEKRRDNMLRDSFLLVVYENMNNGVINVPSVRNATGLSIAEILERLEEEGFDLETQTNVQAKPSNKALLDE